MNEQDLRNLRETLSMFNAASAVHAGIATANRRMFDAYMREGFTREEAMRLLETNPFKITG